MAVPTTVLPMMTRSTRSLPALREILAAVLLTNGSNVPIMAWC
uniref:Uncharacterized protein n=1 Tax=Arundo donax TaxID=35708 RepID=A0A0A9T832_ARUDO